MVLSVRKMFRNLHQQEGDGQAEEFVLATKISGRCICKAHHFIMENDWVKKV
jgi:hypothetical protein